MEKPSAGIQFAPLTILPPRAAAMAPVELLLPSGATLRIGVDAPWELVASVLYACGVGCESARLSHQALPSTVSTPC